jgi:hypothetical protein
MPNQSRCLLLAQSGHPNSRRPLLGVKRTWIRVALMSAYDPLQNLLFVNRLQKPFVGWSVGNFNSVARCQPCSLGWCATEQPE